MNQLTLPKKFIRNLTMAILLSSAAAASAVSFHLRFPLAYLPIGDPTGGFPLDLIQSKNDSEEIPPDVPIPVALQPDLPPGSVEHAFEAGMRQRFHRKGGAREQLSRLAQELRAAVSQLVATDPFLASALDHVVIAVEAATPDVNDSISPEVFSSLRRDLTAIMTGFDQ